MMETLKLPNTFFALSMATVHIHQFSIHEINQERMGINRGIKHLLAQVNPVPTIKLSTHFSIMQHCVDFRPRCTLQILRDVIVTTLDLERHVYTDLV